MQLERIQLRGSVDKFRKGKVWQVVIDENMIFYLVREIAVALKIIFCIYT